MFSLDLGKDGDGKRHRKYIYGTSRADVVRKIEDERARSGGILRPSPTARTVAELIEQWLEEKKYTLTGNGYATYETAWRIHGKPAIGDARLDRFTADDVVRAYAVFAKKAGGRSAQIVGQVCRAAFDAALRRGKIFLNPWRAVPLPRHQYKEARILDASEAQRFIDAARKDRFEALWLLLLTAGLRIGEALGLEWKDVNLDTGRIAVRQQAGVVNGNTVVGSLKTRSSRRMVDIGSATLDALRRRRAAAGREPHNSSFVFTTKNGKLLSRSNLRRDHFAAVCTDAEIDGLTFHSLRHTMTSHALAVGVSPVVVARRLGHASTRMSLDRYGHVLPDQQRDAANRLEEQFLCDVAETAKGNQRPRRALKIVA